MPLQSDLISEVKKTMGGRADEFLPANKKILAIGKETFRSRDYLRAGYQTDTEKYGQGDRFLYVVKFDDQTQLFLMAIKIATSPYQLGSAVTGGLDLRKTLVVVFSYDGQETIIEETIAGTDDKEKQVHKGETGRPEFFLEFTRKELGRPVECLKSGETVAT